MSIATIVRNVRIFDGVDVVPADSAIVEDGLITEVGAGLPPPEGAEVVDGRGGTLLPGLIDAHTHAVPGALEQALVFGITTELDRFSSPRLLDVLRPAVAERADVADLRSAGAGATAPGGHPGAAKLGTQHGALPALDEPEQAAAFVAARAAEGSDYLKIIVEDNTCFGTEPLPCLDERTVSALVAAARENRLLTVAHISTQAGAEQALRAGVDGLAHVFVDEPPEPGFAERARAAGVFVVPTLTIWEAFAGGPAASALASDPALSPYIGSQARSTLTPLSEHGWHPPEDSPPRPECAKAAVQALHRAGVPLLAGTDAINPGSAHGLSLHHELMLLVRAGLAPVEALRAATSAPAATFGLADRGRITTGMRADLLLVDGDPTTDVAATCRIAGVWRAGHRLDREAYRAEVDGDRAS